MSINPFESPLGPPTGNFTPDELLRYYVDICEKAKVEPCLQGAFQNFIPHLNKLKGYFVKIDYNKAQQRQSSPSFSSANNAGVASAFACASALPEGDANVLAGVMLTTEDGGSYDDCMRQCKQVNPNGRIDVYAIKHQLFPLVSFFINNPEIRIGPFDIIFGSVFHDITNIPASSFIVNFECCGGCSDSNDFPGGNINTHNLMKTLTDRGSTIMCADFSAKALIRNWPEYIGSNPFVRPIKSTTSGLMSIVYAPEKMRTGVAQLDLLEHFKDKTGLGVARVNAASSTICYSINPSFDPTTVQYRLDVATVVQSSHSQPTDMTIEVTLTDGTIKKISGDVGHCIIYFPSGGKIVVANVHWKNLTEISTSKESLVSVYASAFGREYSSMVSDELDSTPAPLLPALMREMSSRIMSGYAPTQSPVCASFETPEPSTVVAVPFPMDDINAAATIPEPFKCDQTPCMPNFMP
jgi:hypothetical protein